MAATISPAENTISPPIHFVSAEHYTHMWLFNMSFQNHGYKYAAVTASTPLFSVTVELCVPHLGVHNKRNKVSE